MFCVNCGKPYESDHRFCNSCGQSLAPLEPSLTHPPADSLPSDRISTGAVNSAVHESMRQLIDEQAGKVAYETTAPEMQGLSGWLILVAFGMFVGPLYWAHTIFQDARIFNDGTLQILSDPTSTAYIAGYSALLRFELIGSIMLIAVDIYLLVLFFKKSHHFPNSYIALLCSVLIFTIVDYALVSAGLAGSTEAFRKTLGQSMSGQSTQIGRSLVATIVWSLYMTRSKRVKATFVK